MKRDMKKWVGEVIADPCKKPMPLLSFPCVQLLNVSVRELLSDSGLMARGMKLTAGRVTAGAAVSFMDLSVEAQCFGAEIRFSDNEVPTVSGAIVSTEEQARALRVPEVGACRTGGCIAAVAEAAKLIGDRPVFAGVIGPFSLAGRLMDVSETMVYCYDEPDMVHCVLEKTVEFISGYCAAFKAAGANGVVIAEPLAGLMSPSMAEEFSHPYVKRIIESVQDDEFAVIYHNCGNNTVFMTEGIYGLGAMGYHFGDAVAMADMLKNAPEDALVMGNVSPAEQFMRGTPESVKSAVKSVAEACCRKRNFVLSSGCDIPPGSPWKNIDAFFEAAGEFCRG